jgi:hypothetical protein
MARTVLTDVTVTIGGTSFSNHIKSVTVTSNVDDVELTAMGDTSHTHSPGLRDDSMEFEFYQDFSASVHAAIQPLLGSATGSTIVVHPTSSIGSATNPSMTMVGIPFTYHPLDGTVGAASMTKILFKPAAGSFIAFGTA